MASAHMVCKVFFLFMLRGENLEKGHGSCAHGAQTFVLFMLRGENLEKGHGLCTHGVQSLLHGGHRHAVPAIDGQDELPRLGRVRGELRKPLGWTESRWR